MNKFLTVKNAVGSLTRDASAYTGGGEPVDTDAIGASIIKGLALLSPADRAKVIATITKYSGRPPGRINEVGISAQDAAIAKGRAERDHLSAVARGYKDFWDRKNAADAEIMNRSS